MRRDTDCILHGSVISLVLSYLVLQTKQLLPDNKDYITTNDFTRNVPPNSIRVDL